MSALELKTDLPERRTKTRTSLLGILGACAVVWYLLGLVAWVISLGFTTEAVNSIYSSEQLQYLSQTPIWNWCFNSIALCTGLIGSAYILLRKADAYKWYMLSLGSTLIVMLDTVLRGGFNIMPSTHFGVPIIGIIIGVYLFWVSYIAKNKGELRTA